MPKARRGTLPIGVVARVSSDRVLLAALQIPRLAEQVYDSRLKEVGYVSNVFGPVDSPLLTVKLTSKAKLVEGQELFGRR